MLSAKASNLLRGAFLIAAAIAWGTVGVENSGAADRYWIDPLGGSFNTTTNWSLTSGGPSGASVPTDLDNAFFTLNNTYTVQMQSASVVNEAAFVANGNVTLNLIDEYVLESSNALIVGSTSGQTGRLTVHFGVLRVDTAGDNMVIGNAGGTGFLTVEDDASIGTTTASHKPDLIVGDDGTATFVARERSAVYLNELVVAQALGYSSTATVTGPLAQLDAASGSIGNNGNGTLTINEGAQVSFGSAMNIGVTSTGEGEVNVAGAGTSVSTGSMVIGNNGFGEFVVSAGASAFTSTATIGNSAGSTGDVVVTGSGSLWRQSSDLTVGNVGRGTLTFSSGGHVRTEGNALIGNFVDGGEVNVGSSTSRWDVGGQLTVGGGGFGVLSITSGTVTSASGLIGNGLTAGGSVVVTGANSTWTTGNITVAGSGTGSLSVNSGAIVEATGTVLIDNTFALGGTLTIDGGSLYVAGDFLNNNNLDLSDGLLRVAGAFQPRAASGTYTINGADQADLPTVELIGTGTTSNVTTLTVGSNRRGQLIVRNGRTVSAGANAINIGALAGGDGVVHVGAGGIFGTGGAGSLNVGGAGATAGGTGTVNIASGGVVDVGTLRLHSGGTINLDGGTLSLDAMGPITGQLHWNSGTVRFDALFTTITATEALKFFGADRTLHAGRTLSSPQDLGFSATQLTIDGGNLNAGGLSLSDSAVLEIHSGVAESSATILNAGSIVLSNPLALLRGTTLNNIGTLRGTGLVRAALNNTTSGQVQVASDQRLQLEAPSHTNAGHISVIGGELQVTGVLTNSASTSLVSARDAILRFDGGVINNGSLAFSNGTVDLYGDITQNVGGRITVSGGGIANFYDDVTLVGQAASVQATALGDTISKAVFFGGYNGGLTGGGQAFIEGDHRPGNSPGQVVFSGDVSYGPFSTLHVDLEGTIAGSEYDQIIVTGKMSIGGTLDIDLLNGFDPAAGSSFDILDFNVGNLSGTFSFIELPTLTGGRSWDTSNLYTTGILSVAGPIVPGDFDGDGDVDGADFVAWQTHFPTATGATLTDGDADGDGDVDGADFVVWQTNFPFTPGPGAAPVPEPNAWMLAIVALGMLARASTKSNGPSKAQAGAIEHRIALYPDLKIG